MQILVGGVGYGCLRDLSFGPIAIERLKKLEWPEGVEVEDVSYNPIAVVQKLTEQSYDKVVFIGAMGRGRLQGGIYRYRPDGTLPDKEEIQLRVGEAVTGVISLENLVIICATFDALPRDTVIIEVEPADDQWGEGLSATVEPAVERVIEMVKEEVQVAVHG